MKDISTFDKLIREYDHISIPKIQRDYAQGRDTEKAKDVRENLLNDIFSGNTKSLDFIFGTAKISKENGEKLFIPLDGQQRLTTLFLLYLYGYKMKGLEISNLDRFSYETRKAACDFCRKIVETPWPEVGDKLSESIKKQKWFMSYWQNDPTVEGMLTMLDAIHEKAINSTDYPILNEITFRFFDLNEHGLSDDLYIKMNSRGKPLTAFENFKAALDKLLPDCEILDSTFDWIEEDDDLKEETNFDAKWKYCIDRHWADCFWKYKENFMTDAAFMRFIVNTLSAYWITEMNLSPDDNGEKDDFFQFLLGTTGDEDYISFDDFCRVLPQEKKEIENCDTVRCNTLKYLADSFNYFYQLLKVDNLNEITCPSWENNTEYNLIANVLQHNDNGKYAPSYKDRAMFYALLKCPYIALINEDIDKATEQIKHWMRVFWNIIEQAEVRARNMIGAVKLVKELSDSISIKDKNTDFYKWLIENGNSVKSGFMRDQQREEIAKAKLIVERHFDEDVIKEAEKHPLLKGCISALFENDECSTISFDQSIPERIKLLDDLRNKDCDNNYTLVKVLISRFDNNKKLDGKLYLKKSPENWKDLLTNKLKDCFRKVEDNTISASNINWINILSMTNLIENSRDDGNGKVLGTYGEKVVLWGTVGCTWNANENVILDDIHCNNRVLSDLVEKQIAETSQKVKNCDCFWGRDINFEYDNHYFTWYTNNTICLMKDKWAGKKFKNNELADESGNTYCFKVDNEQENVVNNLDCLIHQAKADELNKPCYDSCQNKVCE